MRAARSCVGVVAVAVAGFALGGCAATYGVAEPVGYVELTSAPVYADWYPNTYYNGRQVYYVDNRWMYRDGGRWMYYQHEPPGLYRQRMYVQQAPPAYPHTYPGYSPGLRPRPYPGPYQTPAHPGPYRTPAHPGPGGAHPGPGGARPPQSAPPAVRVR